MGGAWWRRHAAGTGWWSGPGVVAAVREIGYFRAGRARLRKWPAPWCQKTKLRASKVTREFRHLRVVGGVTRNHAVGKISGGGKSPGSGLATLRVPKLQAEFSVCPGQPHRV